MKNLNATNSEIETGPHRILIIDDNQDIFIDFQTILMGDTSAFALDSILAELSDEEQKGTPPRNIYALEYASQGREGTKKIMQALEENRPFALAFVDMRMPPGWDGFKTIAQIWEIDPEVQVVLCTAYSDYSWEEIDTQIQKPDQFLILKKPFDPAEVAQLASALTKKWSLTKQASIKMHQIEKMVKQRTNELLRINTQLKHEITKRNLAEQALQKTNNALNDSLQTLKNTQEQLVQSEKMAALGDLVAGVAHEINTPLGVGIMAASLLEDKSKEYAECYNSGNLKRSEFEKYLQVALESSAIILTNLNQAADLVKSFKQVAVDQSNEERRRFKLREYIEEMLISLQPRFKKTSHTITVLCDENLELDHYPGIFYQILTNLVINSLIHGFNEQQKGNIQIEISIENNEIIIKYRDDGRGMSQNVLDKLYDPFFTTNRANGGTGLGMHIVYNLVVQTLSGSIRCTSSPGNGVLFAIQIPVETKPSKARNIPVISGINT